MARSNVAIANLALQILGVSERLESLTQDSPNARAINASFDLLREDLLRSFPWNFAKRRASLPALTGQTVWGQLNRFQVPADCLQLLQPTDRFVDWEPEASDGGVGDVIVTRDTGPLNIRYIADIKDPNSFDAEFVQLFAGRIAQQTCQEITGSGEKQQIADGAYKRALQIARNRNAFERSPDAIIQDDYLTEMQAGGTTFPWNGWGF